MRIWIDLVNSPHIPFFKPIINRLEEEGHSVTVTYRDFAQTAQLVDLFEIEATLIGAHGGKNKFGKIKNLIGRTISLYQFAKNKQFDLALSHNSYFQLAAAKLLSIPSITSMDFEGQPANHIAFRLANITAVPAAFPKDALKKFGAKEVRYYNGLKEDICLADFKPVSGYLDVVKKAFNLSNDDIKKPLVVVRPPPSLALYHNDKETLFDHFLDKISQLEVCVLVLPRVESQKAEIKEAFPGFHFSEQVLDGLQLVHCSDVVVSGGGSMNREAACLGVKAISFFSGELPSVDVQLKNEQRLDVIQTNEQVNNLHFVKRKNDIYQPNQTVIDEFMTVVNQLLNKE